MTPRDLTQRRRILFTMLTALTFRYPSGREPALIPVLRAWLSGWPGIGLVALALGPVVYEFVEAGDLPASAAWVSWVEVHDRWGWWRGAQWSPESAHESRSDCIKEAENMTTLRARWAQRDGNQRIATWGDMETLRNAELTREDQLTCAALILFGTHEALTQYLPQAEFIFEHCCPN